MFVLFLAGASMVTTSLVKLHKLFNEAAADEKKLAQKISLKDEDDEEYEELPQAIKDRMNPLLFSDD